MPAHCPRLCSPQSLPLVYHGTRLCIYHCASPWAIASVNLGLPLLSPLVSHCPALVLPLSSPLVYQRRVHVSKAKGPGVQTGSKGSSSQGSQEPKGPGVQRPQGQRAQVTKDSSRNPRVQGSRGLMMQGLEAQGVVHCLRNSQRLGGSRIQGTGSKGSRVTRLKRPRV